jgi:maltose O-acetyltransferase
MDTDSHPIDPHERNQHFLHVMRKGHPADSANMKNVASEPVIIGDDCWISFGVTILKGVSIGPRSVIGAGAIVTSDVPQDSLYFNRVRPVITPIQSRFQQPQSFHEDY